jgi:LacI family transcriptional regulator
LAGVSISTVSRVLNGTALVQDDKRRQVMEAIDRLNFRPNLSARGLRSGSTMTIGVIAQHFDSPYFGRALQGVDDGLASSGYSPIMVAGHWKPAEEVERVELLMARNVDAVIVLGGHMSDADLLRFAQKQPIVVTDRRLIGPNLQSFSFDQREGGRMATAHLIGLDHRQIAHIAGLPGHVDAVQRREGYLQAHAEAGLQVDPRLIVDGDFEPESGHTAMCDLLDRHVPFTAVFCANDQMLYGARLALRRRGLEVPDDISLVGFDDLPDSAYMSPPVTTVLQPVYEMGRAVAAAALEALGSPRPDSVAATPSLSLVVRESTRRL